MRWTWLACVWMSVGACIGADTLPASSLPAGAAGSGGAGAGAASRGAGPGEVRSPTRPGALALDAAAMAGAAAPVVRAPAGSAPSAPTDAQLEATRASLPRPYSVVRVRTESDGEQLALAHRAGEQWSFDGFVGHYDQLCDELPCPWPAELVALEALTEQAPLPASLARDVAYARTLLTFEGEVNIRPRDDSWSTGHPEWLSEITAADEDAMWTGELVPYLERLRRYHPMGRCSRDQWPQTVARLRAMAAVQAGRTGWAAQGWMDTVGYFSAPRMAWSSHGQRHPEEHFALLERVGIDAERFFLGVAISLPGFERYMALGDARRVAADFAPAVRARLAALAADPALDPLNRARFFVISAQGPLEQDARLADLSQPVRAIVERWIR